MHAKLDRKGFSIVEVLITIVVLAVIVGCGWFAWHHTHDKNTSASKSTGSSQQTKSSSTSSSKSTTATTTDPYAGWKPYCDSTYKYCFKYPSDWTLTADSSATSVGDSREATVSDPTNALTVGYVNAFTKDSGLISFTPTKATALQTDAGLTLVGGYEQAGGAIGNYLAVYEIVDTSLLGNYPLAVGSTTQFPSNPRFSDEPSGSGYSGVFLAESGCNTTADCQTWLNATATQTAVQVLESLAYTPSEN
jgi:prepilin-type N-terminal cleavage/methylation domain-containing protein